jgi:hypothetical protein
MGLSIGVHLLNLLTIPAIAFVYYFRKYKPTKKGVIYTSLISIIILAFIQYGIILEMISWAGTMDRIFVNGMGMPFGTGIVIYALILISILIGGVIYSKKKNKPLMNTAFLCVISF